VFSAHKQGNRVGGIKEIELAEPNHASDACIAALRATHGADFASRPGARAGTLHAMTWISLEPGVVVRDVPMPESESWWGTVVEIDNVRVH